MSTMNAISFPLAPRRWLQRALPAVTALLVACGGGGGGSGPGVDDVQGPPSAVATLAASTNDASLSTQAVVRAASAMAEQGGALSSVGDLFGAPLGMGRVVNAATRTRVQAATSLSCAEFLDNANCRGSVVLDTSVSQNATRLVPGDFFALTFRDLAGTLLGDPVEFNGSVRLDLLSTVNLNSSTLAGLDMLITVTNLSGKVAGVAFGPESTTGRVQASAEGEVTVTADGLRFSGLGNITYEGGDDSYTIAGSTVRTAHWTNTAAYVDVDLTNWRVAAGRPLAGSAGSVIAGGNGIAVVVASGTATTVVYDTTITVGGTSTRYRVTATYPVGGGTPTYTSELVQPT